MKQIPALCRLLSALSVFSALQFVACDSSRIISGVYRSEEPVLIADAAGFEQPRWMEMMLAQFGPDLTGIVRVFDEGQFLVPSDDICDCRYVAAGTVSGGEVALSFPTHGECPGDADSPLILGAFVFEQPAVVVDETAGDVLVGHFVSEGSEDTAPVQVTFTRYRSWNQVSESDLSCDDPLVYSGDGG